MKYFVGISILVVLLIGRLPQLSAWVAGEDYLGYNQSWQGARILQQRSAFKAGIIPDANVLFIGSSRTMSFYSPVNILQEMSEQCPDLSTEIFNLGNIANSPLDFFPLHGKFKDRTIIFEFSPRMLLEKPPEDQQSKNSLMQLYKKHQTKKSYIELYASGFVKGALLLGDRLQLKMKLFKLLKQRPAEVPFWKWFYYSLRATGDYDQVLQTKGLVHYRSYIPNAAGGKIFQQILGPDAENYREVLKRPVSHNQLYHFKSIIESLNRENKLIVVRPMVSKRLYQMEQEQMAQPVSEVKAFLAQIGVQYLDANFSHDFQFSDASHIDWYDVKRANSVVFNSGLGSFLCGKN